MDDDRRLCNSGSINNILTEEVIGLPTPYEFKEVYPIIAVTDDGESTPLMYKKYIKELTLLGWSPMALPIITSDYSDKSYAKIKKKLIDKYGESGAKCVINEMKRKAFLTRRRILSQASAMLIILKDPDSLSRNWEIIRNDVEMAFTLDCKICTTIRVNKNGSSIDLIEDFLDAHPYINFIL